MAAVVTGMGAVSPLGVGCPALWEGIVAGRTAIRPIERFSTEPFDVHLGATVPGWPGDHGPWDPSRTRTLCHGFASAAAEEAVRDAGLETSSTPKTRWGLVLGTSLGDRGAGIDALTRALAEHLGIAGPRLTVSMACTSSTHAVGLATDLLALGAADIVLAGGTDVLTPHLLGGFGALGALSTQPCAPFSFPLGTSLGEGAGFVVLEPQAHARDRGAPVRGAVLGYGVAGDGFHPTAPATDGRGVAAAVRAALQQAGIDAERIRHVNAHATATAANDAAEWRGLRRALGPLADGLPVTGSKGHVGHTQGAAGVLEIIVTLLSMGHGVVPATLHHRGSRPRTPPDPVACATVRPHVHDLSLSTNAAFGGANAAVVLGREYEPTPRLARRRVYVRGGGHIGPHGTALAQLVTTGAHRRCAEPGLSEWVPRADPRTVDRSAAMLLVACAAALRDEALTVRGSNRDRFGIVVGQPWAPAEAADALRDSIDRRGIANPCARAFAQSVHNAATGACSRVFGLRGPIGTVAAGSASGLLAMVYAAELLATRTELAAMLGASVDEPGVDRTTDAFEGAAAVVLDTEPGPIRLAGWGIAGPGDRAAATQAAKAMAGVDASEVSLRDMQDTSPSGGRWGGGSATPGLLHVVATIQAADHAPRGAVLVCDDDPRSAAIAVILHREGPHEA